MLRYRLAGCWWWPGAALYCVYLNDQLSCDECFMIVCLSYVAVQQHHNWEINRSVAIDAPLKGESVRRSSLCLLTEQKHYSQSEDPRIFFCDLIVADHQISLSSMSGHEVRAVSWPRHAPLQPDVVAWRATKEEGGLVDVGQTCSFNITCKNIFWLAECSESAAA